KFPGLSPDFLWLNVWAPLDPVSGPLRFYDVDYTLSRPYLIWGLAHLRYWSDLKFYEFLATRLLYSPEAHRSAARLILFLNRQRGPDTPGRLYGFHPMPSGFPMC